MGRATRKEEKALRREIGSLLPAFFGGIGARISARFLPVEIYEETLELPSLEQREFRSFIRMQVSDNAKFTDEFAEEQDDKTISLIIGSGSMNLNPAIVHISLMSVNDNCVVLRLRSLAKEGFIKQQTASRAVTRIKELLNRS